jgi:hypothetical protein
VIIIKNCPEDIAKFELSKWLEENGFKVYWERKNKFGYSIFKTKGSTRKKPDVLIISPTGVTAVIETKCSKATETIEGKKILSYYIDYDREKIKYYVDDKEVIIKYFLLANEYSKEGKLFKNDEPYHHEHYVSGCGYPEYEFEKTKTFIRMLWRDWKVNAERQDYRNRNVGYGFIISNKLIPNPSWISGEERPITPVFFVMKFDNRPDKQKWKHYFSGELYE